MPKEYCWYCIVILALLIAVSCAWSSCKDNAKTSITDENNDSQLDTASPIPVPDDLPGEYCTGDVEPPPGVEARCAELGANCICAERFNTAARDVGYDWNPEDSNTKECTLFNGGTWPTFREAGDLFTDNDPAVLAALPKGHRVDYYLRAPDGYYGPWSTGGSIDGKYTARAAFRFYVYHSKDFMFTSDGVTGCGNKFVQFHTAAHAAGEEDNASFMIEHPYGYLGSMYAFDSDGGWRCESNDPPCPMPIHDVDRAPTPGPEMTIEKWLGKWWRVEVVFRNLAGGPPGSGFDAKIYMKNITDGTQEETYVDWEVPGEGWTPHPALVPPEPIDQFMLNFYREFKDDCSGWRGVSHMMVAGWDTDEGQRIGPACEIESPSP